LEALLRSGWNANEADEEGDTALHRVLRDVTRVCLLLQHGANPLQSNVVGVTPLALAEEQPHWYPDTLSTLRAWVDRRHRDSSSAAVEWTDTHQPHTLSALRERRRETGHRFLWLAAPGTLSGCETALLDALGGSVRVEHDIADREVHARAGFFCLDLTGPWMVFLAVPGSPRMSVSDRANARRLSVAIASALGRCWMLSDESIALVTPGGSRGIGAGREASAHPSRKTAESEAMDVELRGEGLRLPYIEVTTDGLSPRLRVDAPRDLVLAVHLLATGQSAA
jgi:hypothetical protein